MKVCTETLTLKISAKGSGVNLTCPKIKPLNHLNNSPRDNGVQGP